MKIFKTYENVLLNYHDYVLLTDKIDTMII